MTAPAPGEAVPCQWRKRPAVLWGLLWTGANADSIRRFAVSPEGTECTRYQGEGTGLEVWNDQERRWIPCPAGHVVMKGVLGEFYPVSPAALKGTFDPVTGTPGQAATLAELLDDWRDTVRELEAKPFPDDKAARREITTELSVLSTVIGQVERAIAAAPQPAPEGKRVTLKLSEQQPAPELAAAIQDIIDRYPEQQPVPDLAKVLDDFTRTVINVSDRPALTAMARNIRKNHGMEAL